jgi:hypothetical protein
MHRDLKDVVTRAKRAGWSVEPTRGGHLRFCPPAKLGGPCLYTASTPSDRRGLDNLRAQLRRAGLDDPKRQAKKRAK